MNDGRRGYDGIRECGVFGRKRCINHVFNPPHLYKLYGRVGVSSVPCRAIDREGVTTRTIYHLTRAGTVGGWVGVSKRVYWGRVFQVHVRPSHWSWRCHDTTHSPPDKCVSQERQDVSQGKCESGLQVRVRRREWAWVCERGWAWICRDTSHSHLMEVPVDGSVVGIVMMGYY